MAKVQLPLRSDAPFFDFSVELDGVSYGFAFAWNTRSQQWTVQLLTAEEDPVAVSPLVIDLPLFFRSRDARKPPGLLLAVDTSGEGADPGLHDLGSRVVVIYFERSELPAAWGQ